jgi:NTE family protein
LRDALQQAVHHVGVARVDRARRVLLGDERLRQFWSSLAIMAFGVPRFFTPRWWSLEPDDWTRAWTSVYDHRPVRKLLEQYVDFAALKSSPVRLLVSAVDVETAQLEVFDSYVGDFTVDHLLASGSLPPGLPWTTIDGRHYWDGGIVSNSPLDHVVERCGAAGKRVIVVDLFPHLRSLPTNLVDVLSRRDEIVYAERVRRAGVDQALLNDARKLLEAILSMVDQPTADRIRQLPPYVQVMGAPDGPAITRIVRKGAEGEPAGRDFDFSLASIDALIDEGLAAGRQALGTVAGQRLAASAAGAIA